MTKVKPNCSRRPSRYQGIGDLYEVAERRWLRLASEGVVLVLRRSPLGFTFFGGA